MQHLSIYYLSLPYPWWHCAWCTLLESVLVDMQENIANESLNNWMIIALTQSI